MLHFNYDIRLHLQYLALLSSQSVEGAENPKELAEVIRSHAGTTAEIRTLCTDLQV